MANKKMKLKVGKKKKKFSKMKLLFYLGCIYISFAYTFYYSLSFKKPVSNEEFINLLVSTGNANILQEYKTTNIINRTMKFLFEIDFTNPASLLNGSILRLGYGDKEDDTKTISLEYNDDYSNMEELEDISDYIEDPNPVEMAEPIIYLYNSHQLENYSNKDLDIYGITPNVLMASYVLREKLNELGLNTIVEEANMSEVLSKNGWNYSYSYQASRGLMEEKKNQYSTLKYFIDIHRDSLPKNRTTVKIDNKDYAKVLFLIGLENKNYEENLMFTEKINNKLNEYYKGLSKGILKKGGEGVNGVYNQDFNNRTILIEIGGYENTPTEVLNSAIAFSRCFMEVISEETN